MAKFKEADLELTREKDEMRNVEVEIDFTPNALASVLYKQGDTVVLACCTRARNLPRWFPRDATRVGSMQNTAYSPVLPIHDFNVSEEVQRVVPTKSSVWLHAVFGQELILKNLDHTV